MATGDEHDRHVRYLLGELPEPETEAFEDDYFGSDERYGELLAAQDALVEQYLEGRLPADRRERFEQRYLATVEGRRRIDFEGALRRRAASRRPARSAQGTAAAPSATRGRWPAGLAAAAVVLVAAGLVLPGRTREGEEERASLLRRAREQDQRALALEKQLRDLRREIEALRPAASAVEDVLGIRPGDLQAVTLALASSGRRAEGGLPHLTLSREVSLVRLRLALPPTTSSSLRASLQTPEGHTLWSRSGLRAEPAARGAEVTFTVPAAALSAGHYVVTLTDEAAGPRAPSVADFVFQVAGGS